jgi:hypothetical protein
MILAIHRIALGALILAFAILPAQAQRMMNDEQILVQAKRVARGELVEIYQHGIDVEGAKFLRFAEEGYQGIEKVTGLKLDTATLGPRIQIVVSNSASVSHVWRGYDHPRDPRGVVFLNAMAYRGAMKRNNATYIHEMTHLFTWRYRSHTLREGLADWVALAVLPGTGVGPNPNGYDLKMVVPPLIVDYLGTTKPPPDWLTTDAERRTAYYFASYRFVKHLVELKDLATFMQLYNSSAPEADLVTLYGVTRESVAQAAGS